MLFCPEKTINTLSMISLTVMQKSWDIHEQCEMGRRWRDMFKFSPGDCPHHVCKPGGGQWWRPPKLLRLPEGAAPHEHPDKHVGLMEKPILQESSVEHVAVLWPAESKTVVFSRSVWRTSNSRGPVLGIYSQVQNPHKFLNRCFLPISPRLSLVIYPII